MGPTASNLPELRSNFSELYPGLSGVWSFTTGAGAPWGGFFVVRLPGDPLAHPGQLMERWALREWDREWHPTWIDLEATGGTIIDPERLRHLTAHYLAIDAVPDELRETMVELDALGNLLPGWNGYDVAAPKPGSILRAKKWIRKMYEDVARMEAPWQDPHVAADENGDVTFEWWSGNKGLTIYVAEQEVTYLKDWGSDIVTEMEDGLVSTAEQRRELWAWLTS